MARPRIHHLDEATITRAYLDGNTISGLARLHNVDRCVIRRILDDHQIPRQEHRGAHWAHKRAAAATANNTQAGGTR